jgi:hypothetical protein
VDQISAGEMTVDEMSWYHAAPVVLSGERGIWEGGKQEREKEKKIKK